MPPEKTIESDSLKAKIGRRFTRRNLLKGGIGVFALKQAIGLAPFAYWIEEGERTRGELPPFDLMEELRQSRDGKSQLSDEEREFVARLILAKDSKNYEQLAIEMKTLEKILSEQENSKSYKRVLDDINYHPISQFYSRVMGKFLIRVLKSGDTQAMSTILTASPHVFDMTFVTDEKLHRITRGTTKQKEIENLKYLVLNGWSPNEKDSKKYGFAGSEEMAEVIDKAAAELQKSGQARKR